MEEMLITRTMLFLAIRQRNWIEAGTMSAELAENDPDGIIGVVKNAAENAAADDTEAQILLSLWAQIKWIEINED